MKPAAARLRALVAALAATLALTAGTATAVPSHPTAKTVKASPAAPNPCGTAIYRKIGKSQLVGAPPFTRVRLFLNVEVCSGGGLVWAPDIITPEGEHKVPCEGNHIPKEILQPVAGVPRAFDEDTSNCFLDGRGTNDKAPFLLWVYDVVTQVDHTGIPAETYQMWFVVSSSRGPMVTAMGKNLYCIVHPVEGVCSTTGP